MTTRKFILRKSAEWLVVMIAITLAVAGIGLIVTWRNHFLTALLLHPALLYVTSFSFTLASIGTVAGLFHRSLLTISIGALLALGGLISLLETSLLWPAAEQVHYFQAQTSSPPYITIGVAVCLVLAGSGLLMLGRGWPRRYVVPLSAWCGLLIAAFGGFATTDYLIRLEFPLRHFGMITWVPIITLGLLLLGVSIFILALHRSIGRHHSLQQLSLPLITSFGVLVMGAIGYQCLQAYNNATLLFPLVGLVAVSLIAVLAGASVRFKQKMQHQTQAMQRMAVKLKTIIEAMPEGVLVVDNVGRIFTCNRRFIQMWNLPEHYIVEGNHERLMTYLSRQLEKPEKFLLKVEELRKDPAAENLDQFTLKDKRTFERYSQPQRDGAQIIGRLWGFRDITLQRQMERQLLRQAIRDNLTGLPNKALLLDRIQQAINQARSSHTLVAILLLDFDRFKQINNTLGHDDGDEILKLLVMRIRSQLRDNDTLARLAGDQFVMVLTGLNKQESAVSIIKYCIESLAKPFFFHGKTMHMTASMGVSFYPKDGQDIDALLSNADIAMNRAKRNGRNHFEFYTTEMNAYTIEHLQLENELQLALEKNQLLLHYQPIVDLQTEAIIGAEALLRWVHPKRGIISPGVFIPLAEELGIINTLGEWVLNTVCTQSQSWQQNGFVPIRIAINISAYQFKQKSLANVLKTALQKAQMDPKLLELELTEPMLMGDADEVAATLHDLKAAGVSLSIGDFGVGNSSLSCLKRFPINRLKIDRSFVHKIPDSNDEVNFVKAIIAMANSLGITVLAEGIQNIDQLKFLRKLNCTEGQGHYFSKPIEAAALTRMLKKSVNEIVLVD